MSLLDDINEQEAKESKVDKKEKKSPVLKLASPKKKNYEQASIQVEPAMYQKFTQINQMNGQSNNASIRSLIAKFVRENKSLLDEEY